MLGRVFSDARWRWGIRGCRRRDFGHACGRRSNGRLTRHRVELRPLLLPMLFTQFKKLSDAGAHTTEGGNEKPEPPDFASGRKFPRSERSEYDAETREKNLYSALNAGGLFIFASPLSQAPAVSHVYSNGDLTGQLTVLRQNLIRL
jgi:hypothetical protein